MPMFGSIGWFWGLVEEDGRSKLVEIFPGLGYANPWPLSPVEVRDALADVSTTPERKAAYVGARSPEQQAADQRIMDMEAQWAVPLEEA